MNKFIRRLSHLFSKESRRIMIAKEHVNKKISNPDVTIKISLCPVHKDFCSSDGKVNYGSVVNLFRLILNCPSCKVEY